MLRALALLQQTHVVTGVPPCGARTYELLQGYPALLRRTVALARAATLVAATDNGAALASAAATPSDSASGVQFW